MASYMVGYLLIYLIVLTWNLGYNLSLEEENQKLVQVCLQLSLKLRIIHGLPWNQSTANSQFGLSRIPGSSMNYPGTRAQQTVSSDCLRYQDHPWIILQLEHSKWSVWTVWDTRIIHGLSWNQSRANGQFRLSEIPGSPTDCPGTRAGQTVSSDCLR